ncbi:MAG: HD domain-containing protein [Aggregatilineales bacterium]
MMTSSPVLRLRQGVRALLAFSQPVEADLAAAYLVPPLLHLFSAMRRSEQLHSLNVLRAVLAQGETPPELAIAALLHDVGKSRYPLALWQKTVPVIVRALSPAMQAKLSNGDPSVLWRRPFVVYAHHPAWSAELAASAGAPADAVWLIEHHQQDDALWHGHRLHHLLKRLQAADDAN